MPNRSESKGDSRRFLDRLTSPPQNPSDFPFSVQIYPDAVLTHLEPDSPAPYAPGSKESPTHPSKLEAQHPMNFRESRHATRPKQKAQPSHRTAMALTLVMVLCLLGCSPGTESQLSEIRSLQDAGQFEASIVPLRKLLAEDSENTEGSYRLGIALVRTGRSSLAVWPLRKASDSDEYGVQAGLLLGSTLLSGEAADESIRAFSRVIDRDPDNWIALSSRGSAYLSSGLPEKALVDADRLIELQPEAETGTLLRAGALMDLGRSEEAGAILSNIATRASESENPVDAGRKCAALALFYKSREETAESARSTFDECLENFPSDPILQQFAADFFTEANEPERTVSIWAAAVKTTPEDLRLRGKLADALLQSGQVERAEATHRESVELFDTATAWRMLADFHLTQSNPTMAREAYEEAIQRTRDVSAATQFSLADILITEGDFERAREIANSLDEPSYKLLLEGTILLKTNEPEKALAKFDQGLALWPNNAGARYLAGSAAITLGDRARALEEYREAIRADENGTDAALRSAEIYYQMGSFRLALQFAERHIQRRPDPQGQAHTIAARSALALGSAKQAEGILTRLRSRFPNSDVAYVEFAELARRKSGPDAAIEVIRNSDLDLSDPANINALRAIVSDHIALEQFDQAEEAIRNSVAANPTSADSQDLLGQFQRLTGRPTEAMAAFDRALQIEPDRATSLRAKAQITRDQGDLEGAQELLLQSLESDPRSGESLYLIGQLDLMRGDQTSAEQRFRQALKSDPSMLGANNDLAWILASNSQDLDVALKLARRAVALDPTADTLDTLGYVQLKKGDLQAAVDSFSQALDARPESASIRYRLGTALVAQGDSERAQAMLIEALKTPAFPEADSAREALARLQGS